MDQEKQLKPISIERLVDWAFSKEKVAMMAGRDRGIFPELMLLSKTTVTYGERIGGGGAVCGSYDIHPDAQLVYDCWRTVMTYSSEGAAMIRSYGENAMRPDWIAEGALRFVPDIDPATGVPKLARDHNRHLVRDSCRVIRIGKSDVHVRAARGEYRVWWAALHLLQDLVGDAAGKGGGLLAWRLTGEMPPDAPWDVVGAGNGLFFEKAS